MQKPAKKFYLLLIFLHLLVTVPLAYYLNIWVDEASTLYNTEHGFIHTLQNVFHTEKQAPLYFLLLSLWRDFDDSFFFARLFSIVCSSLAIKFFHDLAGKFLTTKQTDLISVFFALHPFLIWISLEIRLYSMIVLLSILLLKFFAEGYLNDSDQKKKRASQYLFVITAIISLYTNYYLGFLLAGGFVALLILKNFQAARNYFLQMLIVGLTILPLGWAIRMQIDTNTGGHKEVIQFVEGLKLMWGHLLTFVLPTELLAPDETTKISFLRVWLVRFAILGLIFLLIKNRFRALDDKVLLFGTLSAVTVAFLLFAFSFLGGEYLALRHMAVLFVPLILFIALLLINLLPPKAWLVLAGTFALLFPYSIYSIYPNLAKRGDWLNIARFIEEREKPGQPILTSQAYDALSLPYHYRGLNQILPDERFFEWDLEDSVKSENGYRKQTEFLMSEIPPDAEYLWLLTRDTCHRPETEASCRPLENFVREHYTIETEKDFYLEKLRLLRKKQ
jgi:hypothetical protein